ncbi:hypothetical protein PRN20_08605 [Devosia sp. ZB163]|jgi:DNA-binding NtrC family response regulator|uniref:hypothetical protein n=1 Tax=Devosia sp. ZB163 TaxID=3025938 RepID=UPI002360B141|nr:hypothetical protein [Devosia sp. ZB163]MDC9823792.1 hypothetical protein [Devosia sp. ZB163]
MAAGRLLVIAPDNDLRRSLVFALEAEGYEVTVRADLPDYSWLARQRFDATVLDQKALTGADYASIAFCVKAYPVVLLAAHAHPWLVQWVTDVVEMPVLGNAISASVRRAMHSEA